MMAGLCGQPEDAAVLERKIMTLDADFRLGIEGVMAGYMLLRGEEGLKVLEDGKMRTKVALDAAGIVSESLGVPPTVVNARFAKPLDVELLEAIAATHDVIVTIEDHAREGGFGSAVVEALPGAAARIERIGIPDRFIQHGRREVLLAEAGVTPAAAAAAALGALRAVVDG